MIVYGACRGSITTPQVMELVSINESVLIAFALKRVTISRHHPSCVATPNDYYVRAREFHK